MKSFRLIREEVANSIGAGGYAGVSDNQPPVGKGITTSGKMLRRKNPLDGDFAGNKVFDVDDDYYLNNINGRSKYNRYKYDDISDYAKKNPNRKIVIRNSSGAMVYLKTGKQ